MSFSKILGTAQLVISFDVDGTLQFGDPPGPITPRTIRALQEARAVIGSASDRTVADQTRLWQQAGIKPVFVVVKNQLKSLLSSFPGGLFVHVGDGFADHLEATKAGAIFVHVNTLSSEQWLEPEHLYRAVRGRRNE